MNNTSTIESFIEYCDNMMIAMETNKYRFKLNSSEFLQNFKVTVKDLEEHVLPLHGKETAENRCHAKKHNPKAKKVYDSYYRPDLTEKPKQICSMIERSILYKRDLIRSEIKSSYLDITRIEFAVPFKRDIGYVLTNGKHKQSVNWLKVVVEVCFSAGEIYLVNAYPITAEAAKLLTGK